MTVPKRNFCFILIFIGPLSLQTRIKFRKSGKGILDCRKVQILIKGQKQFIKLTI